jgi:hypothetical protein
VHGHALVCTATPGLEPCQPHTPHGTTHTPAATQAIAVLKEGSGAAGALNDELTRQIKALTRRLGDQVRGGARGGGNSGGSVAAEAAAFGGGASAKPTWSLMENGGKVCAHMCPTQGVVVAA